MVDNQHQKIQGYRDLSQGEIDLINEIKAQEANFLIAMEAVKALPGVNQRSLAIARTEFQTAMMWAIRAIARPNGE
jgi:hypothetical protein